MDTACNNLAWWRLKLISFSSLGCRQERNDQDWRCYSVKRRPKMWIQLLPTFIFVLSKRNYRGRVWSQTKYFSVYSFTINGCLQTKRKDTWRYFCDSLTLLFWNWQNIKQIRGYLCPIAVRRQRPSYKSCWRNGKEHNILEATDMRIHALIEDSKGTKYISTISCACKNNSFFAQSFDTCCP